MRSGFAIPSLGVPILVKNGHCDSVLEPQAAGDDDVVVMRACMVEPPYVHLFSNGDSPLQVAIVGGIYIVDDLSLAVAA